MRYDDRDDAETGRHHRFRLVSDLPLNEANPDVRVNFLECWEWDGDPVQHFSWVTDLRVNKGTVYLFEALFDGWKKSAPQLTFDSS